MIHGIIRKGTITLLFPLLLLVLPSLPLHAQKLVLSPANKTAWVVQEVLSTLSLLNPPVGIKSAALASELLQWGLEPFSQASVKRIVDKGTASAEGGRLALSVLVSQIAVTAGSPSVKLLTNPALSDGALSPLILRLDDFELADCLARLLQPHAEAYPWTWGLLRWKAGVRIGWRDLDPIAGVFSGNRAEIKTIVQGLARRKSSDAIMASAKAILDFVHVVSAELTGKGAVSGKDLFGDDLSLGLLFLVIPASQRAVLLSRYDAWKLAFPVSYNTASLVSECALVDADAFSGYAKARFEFLASLGASSAFAPLAGDFGRFEATQQAEVLAVAQWLMKKDGDTMPSMRPLALSLLQMRLAGKLPESLTANDFFTRYRTAFAKPEDSLIAALWDIRDPVFTARLDAPPAWSKAKATMIASLASGLTLDAARALVLSSGSASFGELCTVLDAMFARRMDAVARIFDDPQALIILARCAQRADLRSLMAGPGWTAALKADGDAAFFIKAFSSDPELLPMAEKSHASKGRLWTFRLANSDYLSALESEAYSGNPATYASSRLFAETMATSNLALPGRAALLPIFLFDSPGALDKMRDWKERIGPRFGSDTAAREHLAHVCAVIEWWETAGKTVGVPLGAAAKAARNVATLAQYVNESGALPEPEAIAWAGAYQTILKDDPRASRVNLLSLLMANLSRNAVFEAWKGTLRAGSPELIFVENFKNLSIPTDLMKDSGFTEAFNTILGAKGTLADIMGRSWADIVLSGFEENPTHWRWMLYLARIDHAVRTAYLGGISWKYPHDSFVVKLLMKIKDSLDNDPALADRLKKGRDAPFLPEIKQILSLIDSGLSAFFAESDDASLARKILRNKAF